MSSESPPPAHHKKNKPKFTILDDLEELNEIINGPGANEDNLRTQEMLQKTYNYMKGHSSDDDEPQDSMQIAIRVNGQPSSK